MATSRLTPQIFETDVLEAEKAIQTITGRSPLPWFRLPFFDGIDQPWIISTLRALGYTHVGRNVDPGDWPPDATVEGVRERVVDGARRNDPAIVVMHSWPTATAAGTRAAIETLRSEGASFVGVDELDPGDITALQPPFRGR